MMKKRSLIFLSLLAVTVIALYWRTLGYPLIWDDEALFRRNILFTEDIPLSAALKMSYFSEQVGINAPDHYYRPLLTASFILENKLWGIHNTSLRLTNLAIFLLALLFLYLFLRNQAKESYLAEITTLLFALTPLNIDNIVWVVGRADLLFLLWGILSFFFLDLAVRKRRARFLWASSFFFLLGLLSKETTVLFFPLLILYEALKRKKVRVIYHLANLLLVAFYFFLKNSLLGIKNIQVVIYRNIAEDILTAVGTLGYYVRTIIFPISYDRFLPITTVQGLFYVIAGSAAAVFLIFLIIRAVKDKAVAWPLALLLVSLGGHVVLIFSNIFPYQIYSRYMMLSSLAFFWLLAEFLGRLQEKVRFYIVFLLLILFIPSVVLNVNAYKSKTAFWERAYKSLPDDAHVLCERAKTYYEKKDFLSAEVYLNKTLKLNINREIAVLVSLLYADIEMIRANYENVVRWMKSIEPFEQDEKLYSAGQIRLFMNTRIAKVLASRGDFDGAEKLLLDSAQRYSRNTDVYMELYSLYLGFQNWDKAARLEAAMKAAFPRYFAFLDTRKSEQEFAAYSFDRKLGFYVISRNFGRAIEEVQKMPVLDIDHRIFLARLYYLKGSEEDGRKAIADLAASDPANVEVLNKIGNFYLNELFRAKESFVYFEKSLAVSPAQPTLLYLTNRLKNDYLDKLIEVWK